MPQDRPQKVYILFAYDDRADDDSRLYGGLMDVVGIFHTLDEATEAMRQKDYLYYNLLVADNCHYIYMDEDGYKTEEIRAYGDSVPYEAEIY